MSPVELRYCCQTRVKVAGEGGRPSGPPNKFLELLARNLGPDLCECPPTQTTTLSREVLFPLRPTTTKSPNRPVTLSTLNSRMICRRCLQRASSGLSRRVVSPAAAGRQSTPFLNLRALSTSLPRLNGPADQPTEIPIFSTPLADSSSSPEEAAVSTLSACPAGTVLTGLNYFKNQTDPVALTDDKYPEWLWRCLDVQKKDSDATADDAADEFCMCIVLTLPKPTPKLSIIYIAFLYIVQMS